MLCYAGVWRCGHWIASCCYSPLPMSRIPDTMPVESMQSYIRVGLQVVYVLYQSRATGCICLILEQGYRLYMSYIRVGLQAVYQSRTTGYICLILEQGYRLYMSYIRVGLQVVYVLYQSRATGCISVVHLVAMHQQDKGFHNALVGICLWLIVTMSSSSLQYHMKYKYNNWYNNNTMILPCRYV